MFKTFEYQPSNPEPLEDMILHDSSVKYLSSCLDTFNGDISINDRGLRTPTFDESDAVGVDVSSDFHQNGFDRFEAVRDSSLATAERRVAEKQVKEFFQSRKKDESPDDNKKTTE